MKIRLHTVYAGPNIHLPVPAIHWIFESGDLGTWQGPVSAVEFLSSLFPHLPTLRQRLEAALPGTATATSAQGKDGRSLAELVMHAAMELQTVAGHAGTLSKVVLADDGSVHIVCEHKEEPIGRLSVEAASALVAQLTAPGDGTAQALVRILQTFHRRIEREALDQTTRALVQAAEARGLTWFRLAPETRSVQLGHGCFSRRLFESMPGSEGFIAGRLIVPNKAIVNRMLRAVGLPVPGQIAVTEARQAAQAADRLGYPVVLKPKVGTKGRGVIVGLRDGEAVRRAFEQAFKPGTPALVEQFLPGDDHRLLVVGGRLIAAARRIPGGVVGDGRSSIRTLVEQVNRDPRRGVRFTKVMVRLGLDGTARQMLAEQGLDETSVPAAGRRVYLRKTANISTGGTAIDVTDRVHPDVRRMAELTAQVIGLDVAGIDFITPDIGRSSREAGGINEVNVCPGLRPHWIAEGGEQRDVVGPILDLLYPPGQSHHVPIVAVTGTNGKTTTSHMVAQMLREGGHHVGLVTTLGTAVDGQRIATGDRAGPGGFDMVARNPNVDAIVAEVARGALIRRGMGFQSCDVGAVLNVTTDHLGEFGVDSLEDMARVKETVARTVTGTLVLNADDPLCLAMAPRATAQRVCLVTLEKDCPALSAHVAAGGWGARLIEQDGGEVLALCRGDETLTLLPVAEMPAAFGGTARHNLQNALFAAALAYGMGMTVEVIHRALAGFRCDHETIPGRLNVFDSHPFKVILDYGHNSGGYRMVGPVVTAMAGDKGRRICVFTSPADRNDAHLIEIAEAAAPHFDFFVCRRGLRQNREPGEVPDKLRDALIANGIAEDRITLGGDPESAVLAGLDMAEPGDVVYVMSTPDPTGSFWPLICNYRRETANDRRAE